MGFSREGPRGNTREITNASNVLCVHVHIPYRTAKPSREVVSRTFGCNLSEACLPELPRTGHYAKGCAARGARDRPGCQKKHHSLLHPPAEMGEIREGENSLIASQGSVNVLKGGERPSEKRVCLRVVPLRVQGCSNSRIAETYALLDDGSDLSLCDLQLLEKLGLSGVQRQFTL